MKNVNTSRLKSICNKIETLQQELFRCELDLNKTDRHNKAYKALCEAEINARKSRIEYRLNQLTDELIVFAENPFEEDYF